MGCGGAGLRAAGVELGFGGVLQLTGLSKSGLPPMACRTLAALFMCLRHGRGTSAAWYRGGRGRVRHEHATVNARGQEQGSGAGDVGCFHPRFVFVSRRSLGAGGRHRVHQRWGPHARRDRASHTSHRTRMVPRWTQAAIVEGISKGGNIRQLFFR